MFSLHGVTFTYPGASAPVLRVPEWLAQRGEHWALVGRSGSGKSTLLHLLAGLLTVDEGSLVVAGQDLAELRGGARDRWRGRTIGFVPQRLHLLRTLSVIDNVLLAPYLAGLPSREHRARQVLDSLGLGERQHARPAALSQGEAQRVAIARAVVNRPAVLLADEPTASLDDDNCRAALEVLTSQARAVDATLVVATHDPRVREAIGNVRVLER